MKIVWSPLAVDRLTEIGEHIAAERPNAAEKLIDRIVDVVGRLAEFPESGRVVPEAHHRPELREVLVGRYRIICRVATDRVLILTVRHSRQLTEREDLGG